jgi:hypothetical protein
VGIRVERPGRATGQADRITELWAWTVVDPITNVEGILSFRSLTTREMPMVVTVRRLADQLEPFAQAVGREIGATPRLRRFIPAGDHDNTYPEPSLAVV